MPPAKLDQLRRRAEATNRQYQAHFAGQPRITRSPALLESMREEMDEALADAATLEDGEEEQALITELNRQRSLYAEEIQAVRSAQAGGPGAYEAHRLGTWAELIFARYRRHFAGQSRSTRSLILLSELRSDLAQIEAELKTSSGHLKTEELQSLLESVERNGKLYRQEQAAVQSAHEEENSEARSSALANLANQQFATYGALFSGKSRLARRPARLSAMLQTLIETQSSMQALLDAGHAVETNQGNIAVISKRLKSYREELAAIREARRSASFSDLIGGLAEAANSCFAVYEREFAGQDRATRDSEALVTLCDELYDLAHQMHQLDRLMMDSANRKNLSTVLENLRMYGREYDRISKARQHH